MISPLEEYISIKKFSFNGNFNYQLKYTNSSIKTGEDEGEMITYRTPSMVYRIKVGKYYYKLSLLYNKSLKLKKSVILEIKKRRKLKNWSDKEMDHKMMKYMLEIKKRRKL